jgi:hypothetical protein
MRNLVVAAPRRKKTEIAKDLRWKYFIIKG